jgi:hypothetical protein
MRVVDAFIVLQRAIVGIRLKEQRIFTVRMRHLSSFAVEPEVMVYRFLHILRRWPDIFPPHFDLAPERPSPVTSLYGRDAQREAEHDGHQGVTRPLRFLSCQAREQVAHLSGERTPGRFGGQLGWRNQLYRGRVKRNDACRFQIFEEGVMTDSLKETVAGCHLCQCRESHQVLHVGRDNFSRVLSLCKAKEIDYQPTVGAVGRTGNRLIDEWISELWVKLSRGAFSLGKDFRSLCFCRHVKEPFRFNLTGKIGLVLTQQTSTSNNILHKISIMRNAVSKNVKQVKCCWTRRINNKFGHSNVQ